MTSDETGDDFTTVEESELGDYIGGYWYTQEDSPRWKRLKDIEIDEDGNVTFHTKSCSAESVPHPIRQKAYDLYSGGNLLLEPKNT